MKDSEILKEAIARIANCTTEAEILKLADRVDEAGPAEMNFPAEVIIFAGQLLAGPARFDYLNKIMASAEMSMLQLAFFNAGEQPPCSFIMAVHAAGWRAGTVTFLERISLL